MRKRIRSQSIQSQIKLVMPYIYTKGKNGKITSFYTKDKSVKVGNEIYEVNRFSTPKEVVKVKFTKRDNI